MRDDHVARIRKQSRQPQSGDSPLEVVSRVFRLCAYLEGQVGAAFATVGLSRTEADLLGALHRSPEPAVPPSRLATQLVCSTGTMTNRLDRLERAGFLRRSDDPNDRRGVLIALTPKGRAAIAAARAARERVEPSLVPGLTLAERRQLANLLRRVLAEVERVPASNLTESYLSTRKKRRRHTIAGNI